MDYRLTAKAKTLRQIHVAQQQSCFIEIKNCEYNKQLNDKDNNETPHIQ